MAANKEKVFNYLKSVLLGKNVTLVNLASAEILKDAPWSAEQNSELQVVISTLKAQFPNTAADNAKVLNTAIENLENAIRGKKAP